MASSMRSISRAGRRDDSAILSGAVFGHGAAQRNGSIDEVRAWKSKKTLTAPAGRLSKRVSAVTCLVPANSARPGSCDGQAGRDARSADRAREADHPHSPIVRFGADNPLRLDAGVDFAPFQIAYQTYGKLNAERTNAVLVCHALTGDQHAANVHPVTGKRGWWETMVGPGRPIDTDRYFVICPNVVGGCMGSSGPASTNPATGLPYGLDFPVITVRDMVRAQAMLLDYLGIDSLFAVAGGSMGGMQVLQWAASYPQRVFAALPIAAATRHSAQNIAFHEVGRQAVMADPDWRGGRYFVEGTNPRRGLAVARMGAHITYLSDAALHRKFGRRFQDRDNPTFSFDADFQVE